MKGEKISSNVPQKAREHYFGAVTDGVDSRVLHDDSLVAEKNRKKDGFIKTTKNTFQGRVQKTEVSFRGESYNVTSGCPSKNPEVLR